MKRALYVLGPESSGTRFVTGLLIGAGCVGDADHAQRWDSQPFGDADPVVWRRSVPHNRAWPSLREMLDKAQGRSVQVVVCVRDWEPMARSQVATGHVPSYERAMQHIRRATLDIHRQVEEAMVPYTTAVYESLVTSPSGAIPALLQRLGLPAPGDVVVTNGNTKWWSQATKERDVNETSKKMLKEIVYYFPDHRANAPHAIAAEGFVLDTEGEGQDSFETQEEGDALRWKGRQITVRPGWLYRTIRMVEKKEPAKDAVKLD